MKNIIKYCSKCKKDKKLLYFSKNKHMKDGYCNWCKECTKNKYKKNFKNYKINKKIYYNKNKKRILKQKKKYYNKNKEFIKAKTTNYRKTNKSIIKKVRKKYYYKNREKLLEQKKKYWKKNKRKLLKQRNEYRKNRFKKDISFKILYNIRSRITMALKGKDKSDFSLRLLGCTIQELKQYLESQFKEGMTWDNHGYYGWHIDHIKPCASFDLSKPSEQRKCFHYTNLQPLWMKENFSKKDKY